MLPRARRFYIANEGFARRGQFFSKRRAGEVIIVIVAYSLRAAGKQGEVIGLAGMRNGKRIRKQHASISQVINIRVAIVAADNLAKIMVFFYNKNHMIESRNPACRARPAAARTRRSAARTARSRRWAAAGTGTGGAAT